MLLTHEPEGPSIAVAIAAVAVAASAIAALAFLGSTPSGRSTRARSARTRAMRRGAEVGAAIGLVAALQVVGGLTPLTALFVFLSFAIAEYVVSAGAPS